jgi:hypothetical protein
MIVKWADPNHRHKEIIMNIQKIHFAPLCHLHRTCHVLRLFLKLYYHYTFLSYRVLRTTLAHIECLNQSKPKEGRASPC